MGTWPLPGHLATWTCPLPTGARSRPHHVRSLPHGRCLEARRSWRVFREGVAPFGDTALKFTPQPGFESAVVAVSVGDDSVQQDIEQTLMQAYKHTIIQSSYRGDLPPGLLHRSTAPLHRYFTGGWTSLRIVRQGGSGREATSSCDVADQVRRDQARRVRITSATR